MINERARSAKRLLPWFIGKIRVRAARPGPAHNNAFEKPIFIKLCIRFTCSLHRVVGMGVATEGDAGDVSPPRFEIPGGMSPPEIAIFKGNFMHIYQYFQIFHYFLNKVGEIRGEIGIWGRWF